ncbi:MAG: DUF2007 domain-containing protein [Muribaculaceae bacterium]|nr:DUF2007 domain-containing protein [Muribaculaceae bacterium]
MNESTWVTAATFSSVEDGYIVKGMLESNGIPVELNNATISSVYPMTDTWAPLELMVPADHIDDALKLINANN